MSNESHRNALQPGFLVHWYAIARILGQGGFGITYLAEDTNLHQPVAIKEYLPLDVSVREGDWSVHPVSQNHDASFQWGLQRFLDEARTLARFDHPNIVRVLSVFEMNNTAYMIMRYESGKSFAQLLSKRATLDEQRLKGVLLPILDGLQRVHEAGFIHRDIKPANLFIRDDDSPVLLDFGSARQSLGDVTRTLTTLVSPGYAPFEQYYSKSDKQGPWTDIYGLGATMYRAIVGVAPMNAVDRSEGILKRREDPLPAAEVAAQGMYSAQFLRAIDWALRFDENDRPQTINAWKAAIDGDDIPAAGSGRADSDATAATVPAPAFAPTDAADYAAREGTTTAVPTTAPSPVTRKGRRRSLWLIAAIVIALVLALAALNKTRQARRLQDNPAQSSEATNDAATEATPSSVDLNPVRASDEAQLQQMLQAARDDLREQRVSRPPGNNAVEKYRAVLARDPKNQEAKSALHDIVESHVERAKRAFKAGEHDKAERLLQEALVIAPNSKALRKALERLDQARRRND